MLIGKRTGGDVGSSARSSFPARRALVLEDPCAETRDQQVYLRALSPKSICVSLQASQRPDIRQSKLQLTNGERAVAGSSNARLPKLDVYGSFQTRGVIVPGLLPTAGDAATGTPLFVTVPAGGKSASRIFEAGIQFNLPIQNKVALANLGADRTELRQEQLRVTQLETQVAAEVRNTSIALQAAKVAVQSAHDSRRLQEQLLGRAGKIQCRHVF